MAGISFNANKTMMIFSILAKQKLTVLTYLVKFPHFEGNIVFKCGIFFSLRGNSPFGEILDDFYVEVVKKGSRQK